LSDTIQVRVILRAKRNEVKGEGNVFKVYLTAPPVEGKANKLLVELLSRHFNLRKSQIRIIKGEKARDKIVRIGV
jgi:uncharacterized protein (TIGR00251 family)